MGVSSQFSATHQQTFKFFSSVAFLLSFSFAFVNLDVVDHEVVRNISKSGSGGGESFFHCGFAFRCGVLFDLR